LTSSLPADFSQKPSNPDDWEDEPVDANHSLTCIGRWRNAGPDTHKKMFSVFDESGIFIAACCHRFILLACDMIRSGELFVDLPSINFVLH
jgi:hypothetical protein